MGIRRPQLWGIAILLSAMVKASWAVPVAGPGNTNPSTTPTLDNLDGFTGECKDLIEYLYSRDFDEVSTRSNDAPLDQQLAIASPEDVNPSVMLHDVEGLIEQCEDLIQYVNSQTNFDHASTTTNVPPRDQLTTSPVEPPIARQAESDLRGSAMNTGGQLDPATKILLSKLNQLKPLAPKPGQVDQEKMIRLSQLTTLGLLAPASGPAVSNPVSQDLDYDFPIDLKRLLDRKDKIPCSMCSETFRDLGNFTGHLRGTHKLNDAAIQKIYGTKYLHAWFPSRNDGSGANTSFNFQCPFCPNSSPPYKLVYPFRAHLSQKHGYSEKDMDAIILECVRREFPN